MEARIWVPGVTAARAFPLAQEALRARGWRLLESVAPHRARFARARPRGLYQGAEQTATLELHEDRGRLLVNLRGDPIAGTHIAGDRAGLGEDLEAIGRALRAHGEKAGGP